MSDITAKYRTRHPPKEHEEAVKMLLDGITRNHPKTVESKLHNNNDSKSFSNKQYNNNMEYSQTQRPFRSNRKMQDLTDCRSINSTDQEELESSSSGNVSGGIQMAKSLNDEDDSIPRMKSKSTSTSDSVSMVSSDRRTDSISTTGSGFEDSIPSRTIAVQCDLKPSSAKRADGTFDSFDGSQQASSISSTRYGFYRLSPESVEVRRKLQRSLSTRNIMHRSESENETENFKSLSKNKLNSNQVEAPTSMSELSASSSASEVEFVGDRFNVNGGKKLLKSTSTRRLDDRQVDFGHDYDEEIANVGRMSNSSSRAKDLYPQRPKTALSYVSTSRLRDSESPARSDRCQNRERELQANRMRARATSHQALTRSVSRNSGRHEDPETTSCSSDTEIDTYRAAQNKRHRQPVDRFRLPCNEEIQVECDKCEPDEVDYAPQTVKLSSSRPALNGNLDTNTKHNRAARDRLAYSTLDRGLSTRQTTGGLHYADKNVASWAPQKSAPMGKSSSLQRRSETSRLVDEPAIDGELLADRKRINGAQGYRESATLRHSRPPSSMTSGNYADGTTGSRPVLRESSTLMRNHKLNHEQQQASSDENRQSHRRTSASLANRTVAGLPTNGNKNVIRSTSMRQINRTSPRDHYSNQPDVYTTPNSNLHPHDRDDKIIRKTPRQQQQAYPEMQKPNQHRQDSEDSESPSTKTWTSPVKSQLINGGGQPGKQQQGCSRSYSMRDIHNIHHQNDNLVKIRRHPQQQQHINQQQQSYMMQNNNMDEHYNYQSSSESSLIENHHNPSTIRQQYLHPSSSHQQLDFDSQQRLNEIGLPKPTAEVLTTSRRRAPQIGTAASYLGVSGSATNLRHSNDILSRYAAQPSATGYPSGQMITGRAMSQQSLARPTMPLGRSRRRAGSSNSGSDVGGSSMSLVSRLHGRYENAHTRSPVIMYIPQAAPKWSSNGSGLVSDSGIGKSNSQIRKSTRSSRHFRMTSGSQDRLKRSVSRNGSDSESSSMLRTLVKPRNVALGGQRSRRSSRTNIANNDQFDDVEDMDGIGQLASEMDSYKFRRRYSVPKDAKINWFAKLKNRVSSKM